MRHTTWFPNEFRDFVIALIALILTAMIWGLFFAPAVI